MPNAYINDGAARRNVAIDGLRGLAALSVTFYHGLLHFDTAAVQRVAFPGAADVHGAHDLWLKFLLTMMNGEYAVVIFFILSGLVLGRSLDRLGDRSALAVVFDFVVKRVLRIYPAVVVCVLFMVALTILPRFGIPLFPPFSLRDLTRAALLVDVRVHGPMWTLQVEMLAVPFMLVAYLLRRSIGFYTAGLAFFYALAGLQYPALGFGFSPLSGSLICFAVGMVIGLPGMDALFRAPGKGAAVVLALYFLGVRQIMGHDSGAGLYTQVAAGGMLVAVLFYSDGPLARLLSSRVPQLLGRISYSFYLLNVPVITVIWAALDTYVPAAHVYTITAGLLSAILASAIAMPLSVLVERHVEQPGIRLGRAIANWKGRENQGGAAPVA